MANNSVAYVFSFPGGGIGRYVHELLSVMERSNWDVRLLSLPEYHWRTDATYEVVPCLATISSRNAIVRKSRFLLGQYRHGRNVIRELEKLCPNVVHFETFPHLFWPQWRKGLSKSAPVVAVTAHDVERRAAILNKSIESRQLRSFYRNADCLFVHSDAQKEDLLRFSGVDDWKVTVVPHGPYCHGAPAESRQALRQKYGIPKDVRVGLSFGFVRDDKNIDLIIRAFARSKSPDWLVVAGQGNAKGQKSFDYYQRLAREYRVDSRVVFLEKYLTDEEVSELHTLCDWVNLCYGESFTSQSGVLAGSVRYCRPVLMSRTSTLNEVLGSYRIGIGVEPDSLNSLVKGLDEISKKVACGKSYFEFDSFVRDHSWQRNVDLRTTAYSEVLARRRNG